MLDLMMRLDDAEKIDKYNGDLKLQYEAELARREALQQAIGERCGDDLATDIFLRAKEILGL